MKTTLLGVKRLLGLSGPTAISPIAHSVRNARLTYLSDAKLSAIEKAVEDVERLGVPGSFIECGIALGGSAIAIATLMHGGRQFHGYDVFGTIPPPASEHDDEKSKTHYETIKSGRSQVSAVTSTMGMSKISTSGSWTISRVSARP